MSGTEDIPTLRLEWVVSPGVQAYASVAEFDESVHPHGHDFHEVSVVLSGRATYRTIHGSRRVRPGDAMIIRPGMWHAFTACRRLRVGNLGYSSLFRAAELGWTQRDPKLYELLWTGQRGDAKPRALRLVRESLTRARRQLRALAKLSPFQTPGTHARFVGIAHLVIQELACAARGVTPARKPAPSSPGRAPHPAIATIIDLFESDLTTDWTLPALAERLKLNPSHLSRVFRATTGLAPMAYLDRCRMERAAALLIRTEDAIGSVGAAIGVADANYFARRFRAHFGMSATLFREKYADVR